MLVIFFHFRGCLKCMIIYQKHHNVLQYREGKWKAKKEMFTNNIQFIIFTIKKWNCHCWILCHSGSDQFSVTTNRIWTRATVLFQILLTRIAGLYKNAPLHYSWIWCINQWSFIIWSLVLTIKVILVWNLKSPYMYIYRGITKKVIVTHRWNDERR